MISALPMMNLRPIELIGSRRGLRLLFALVVVSLIQVGQANTVIAQAGLRESLERLDANGNGEIEPDEITPLSRPYLERIAESRRMSLDRPNPIDKLQEAARIYFAKQNGVARDEVRPERTGQLRSFGAERNEPMIPEFGVGELKFPYTERDLDEAEQTLRRHDRNRDGIIDRGEARRADWSYRDPFDDDLNKDDRLTRLELAQRYARRRILANDSDELIQKARRAGNGIAPSKSNSPSSGRGEPRMRGRSNSWLAYSLFSRFDTNRDGRLDRNESASLGMPVGEIDTDRSGEISRDELSRYVDSMQEAAGGYEQGIPGWFYELDVDKDNQISLAEFSRPTGADALPDFTFELIEESNADRVAEKITEFNSLDVNADGLLTASEITNSQAVMGGVFTSNGAQTLPPGRTVVSEIEISEDFLIADLNVQLSITHSHADHLDGYLIGPDGTRIELFTAVGGNDDNFEETIFDDQASVPITKGRPPFEGEFLPEGILKRQPGLSSFNGKSIQGTWQLSLRGTRSDRFGILHGWNLQVRPLEL